MIYDLIDCCFGNMCIRRLQKENSFAIRHLRGDTEGVHMIADVFLEGDLFKGYHCDIDIKNNRDTIFFFTRRR